MQPGNVRRFIIDVDKEFDERYPYLNFWDYDSDNEERVYNGYTISFRGIAAAFIDYLSQGSNKTHEIL